jgi:hypothetical protein
MRLPRLMKTVARIRARIALFGLLLSSCRLPVLGIPPQPHTPCRVLSTTFAGWNAIEMSNDWVRLDVVPQLGGRLMQVAFDGHPYLFVNPKYKGRYFPPSAAQKHEWFNYGGDKLWPLPEGHGEGQWPGPVSDLLDDGEYKPTILSQSGECRVHLEGPGDPDTGLQYLRDISIGVDSPQISFRSVMRNISSRPIRWSVQSVTQYDTADAEHPEQYNQSFGAFAPLNQASAYPNGYFVRSGLADDPSFSVDDGIFKLHWFYLENEVWLDSSAGWIAVVDDTSKYAVVERFHYLANAQYPGGASVIFYKNGAALTLDEHGMPALRSDNPHDAPYYMEAELNGPIVELAPGASFTMDTDWVPTRAGKGVTAVAPVGLIERPLAAIATSKGIQLSGAFGVFFPGTLVVHVLDVHGIEITSVELITVDPKTAVQLNEVIKISGPGASVALHFKDERGIDRGILSESKIRNDKSNP